MNLELHTMGSNHERVFISAGKTMDTTSPFQETVTIIFDCSATMISKDIRGRDREESIWIALQWTKIARALIIYVNNI